ncbi:MAG: hypothetical protein LBN95_13380, partial [Prevotellaceae bacterium]|nr:hypothetical protein [Prevotellaceae bacterium]
KNSFILLCFELLLILNGFYGWLMRVPKSKKSSSQSKKEDNTTQIINGFGKCNGSKNNFFNLLKKQ